MGVAKIKSAAQSAPQVQAQIELITPEIAGNMLEANSFNRPLSQSTVNLYSRDMQNGRWHMNGDAIRFSAEGVLLDGQHRLEAVRDAGVDVWMMVIRNLPSVVFATIDAGRKRSAGDILAIENVPNANVVASAGRFAMLYNKGLAINYPASRTEVTEYVEHHPYLIEMGRLVMASNSIRRVVSPSALAAVLFLANERRLFDADMEAFLYGLATGANLSQGDPRLTLRDWAVNGKAKARGNLHPRTQFYAIARAWNAHVRGERLHHIKIMGTLVSRENTLIVGYHE